ncbi:unnamed protein product [Choristocarpus tenellus]
MSGRHSRHRDYRVDERDGARDRERRWERNRRQERDQDEERVDRDRDRRSWRSSKQRYDHRSRSRSRRRDRRRSKSRDRSRSPWRGNRSNVRSRSRSLGRRARSRSPMELPTRDELDTPGRKKDNYDSNGHNGKYCSPSPTELASGEGTTSQEIHVSDRVGVHEGRPSEVKVASRKGNVRRKKGTGKVKSEGGTTLLSFGDELQGDGGENHFQVSAWSVAYGHLLHYYLIFPTMLTYWIHHRQQMTIIE